MLSVRAFAQVFVHLHTRMTCYDFADCLVDVTDADQPNHLIWRHEGDNKEYGFAGVEGGCGGVADEKTEDFWWQGGMWGYHQTLLVLHVHVRHPH